MNMKIKVFSNKLEASEYVAAAIQTLVANKPNANLGMATGSTPELTYARLVALYQENTIDFSQSKSFNLDEYYKLDFENEQSYHFYMKQHLFNHINIKSENTFFPSEGIDFDQLIAQHGGIDLQILGIGTNGHIGFNEPGSSANSETRIVDLSKNTISDNARYFASEAEVPTQAISMGLKTIMQAHKIYLLAFGSGKRAIVQQLLKHKNFNPELPATILLNHPNVELILDAEAWDN